MTSRAVFGDLSVLLDQPHTADVRALKVWQFTLPMRLPYSRATRSRPLLGMILAQRLDSANRSLLELKRQIQAGEPGG